MKGSNNNFVKFWKVGIVLIFLRFQFMARQFKKHHPAQSIIGNHVEL